MKEDPLNEVTSAIIITYSNIKEGSSYEFLFDYSKLLIKEKLYDPQILYWQIEYSSLLKPFGLNFSFLKKKMEEKNKKYYKYDTFMNQITYRLEKHGQLAPIKEIAKHLTEEDMKDKDNNERNPNEINYYDQNDSFIDDEDAFNGDLNDQTSKLNLLPGNYTEEMIIKNLNRNKKKIKKNFKKKKNNNNENVNETYQNLISTNTHFEGISPEMEEELNKKIKKRKFGEGITSLSENADRESIERMYNQLMKDYCESGKGIPDKDNEKEIFIKKSIPQLKNIDGNNKIEIIKVFSQKLKMDEKEFEILFNYEVFKSKIEGTFSTFSKLLNQFCTSLYENDISDFTNLKETFESNSEIYSKFSILVQKIIVFRQLHNEYIGAQMDKLDNIYEIINKYISGVRERNNEYLTKISSKIKESFEKNRIKYSIDNIVDFIKKNFDSIEYEENLTDLNHPILGIERFLYYQEQNKNINTKNKQNIQQQNKKKQNVKSPKKEDENDVKIEIKSIPTKIINENVLGYKVQLTPILSHKFYYKNYEPDDFPEKKNIQNNEFTNLTTENFSLENRIQKENQNLNTTTNEIKEEK